MVLMNTLYSANYLHLAPLNFVPENNPCSMCWFKDSDFWFMDAIVKPLGEKLHTHFASESSSTTDITKPQWLFKTAGKIMKDHGAGMSFFQVHTLAHL